MSTLHLLIAALIACHGGNAADIPKIEDCLMKFEYKFPKTEEDLIRRTLG